MLRIEEKIRRVPPGAGADPAGHAPGARFRPVAGGTSLPLQDQVHVPVQRVAQVIAHDRPSRAAMRRRAAAFCIPEARAGRCAAGTWRCATTPVAHEAVPCPSPAARPTASGRRAPAPASCRRIRRSAPALRRTPTRSRPAPRRCLAPAPEARRNAAWPVWKGIASRHAGRRDSRQRRDLAFDSASLSPRSKLGAGWPDAQAR